jgi:hypothetical protein
LNSCTHSFIGMVILWGLSFFEFPVDLDISSLSDR